MQPTRASVYTNGGVTDTSAKDHRRCYSNKRTSDHVLVTCDSSQGLTEQRPLCIPPAGYAKAEPDVVLALLLTLPSTLNPLLVALLATCREEDKKLVPGVLQKVMWWCFCCFLHTILYPLPSNSHASDESPV
jgi:hypothetical protein